MASDYTPIAHQPLLTCVMIDDQKGELRKAIVSLLEKRDVGKTICSSEASRAVFGASRGNEMEHIDLTREVVNTLVDEGMIEACQRRQVVDIDEGKGPIRLRMAVG